ncbi:MAG TPA: ABC-F family ATP-binding cassette domain-containing protein [Chthoniobacteraceae bacterium]|nr:ABC-F family ATP-binding cassette domain-containing protein [Chthoniobacteraceae bacterium]
MPETILSASELNVHYGDRVVLDGAGVVVHADDRVGMVGSNGAGKSTFLKIAAGMMPPDSGNVVRRRDLVTGYLPQVFDLADDKTVHENILDGARYALEMIREYEQTPADSARSGELLGKIEHAGGWDIEHRTRSLITHLHAPEADRITGTLSGGEKRRVALCRALLAQPDFLILDEPTNHLDTESIEWLEDFLKKYPGAVLFVTHDRYFLDRISTRIVEVARGKIFTHEGNYTDYLLAKAERMAIEEQQERGRQKFLKKELEWIRRRPSAQRTKSRDRVDRFYETAAIAAPEKELDVELVIPPAPKLANRIIELKEVAAEIGGRTLFSGLNLNLQAGSRLGIVGRNGLGKTTLLRIILGDLAPSRGTVEIGTRTQINYIDQGRLLLDDTKTIFQEVGENSEHVKLGEETITLRAYLRRFLFTEDRINTRIELLSGGERSRVILAKILKRGGNVLVLDEPTNDLDLATLRLLEEALIAFEGVVLVVSHDRYFLNRVCTGIIAFEGEGRVTQHVGNYEYYTEKRAQAATAEANAFEPAKAASKNPVRPRKLSYKESREIETIESDILAAETAVSDLETIFAAPDFYEKHGDQWEKLDAQLKAGRKKVAALYARWEELEKIRALTMIPEDPS